MPESNWNSRIADAVAFVHDRFVDHGIWHCLTYGTLLGAIREENLIAWDYDFDFFVKPSQVHQILALNDEIADAGYSFRQMWIYGEILAINPLGLGLTPGHHIGVFHHEDKLGDLYWMTLFNDGVLRRYDLEYETYWLPRSSFPHYFVEDLETARLRGRNYPVPRCPEKFIAGVYGEDWRIPYRAERQGGETREGLTEYGDVAAPKLKQEIAWCEARGWDRAQYRFEHSWPRTIRAAGPLGAHPRTLDSSRSPWWRTLEELIELY